MRKAILFIDICRMCTGVFLFQWVNKWVNFHGHNIDCILNFVSISVKVESPFQLQCFWWVFINYPFIPNSIARKNMRCVSVRCKSTLLRLFSSTGYESRTLYVSVNVSNLNSFHCFSIRSPIALFSMVPARWGSKLRNLHRTTYQKGKLQAVIVKWMCGSNHVVTYPAKQRPHNWQWEPLSLPSFYHSRWVFLTILSLIE